MYRGKGLDNYDRHRAVMEQTTMFYNPWQYRILAPLAVEGVYQVMDHTIYQAIDFELIAKRMQSVNLEGKDDITTTLITRAQNPDYIKYLIVFILVRWALNILLFIVLILYWRLFTDNKYLLYLALLFFSLILGNSVNDSDFSFNTIIDNLLYLFAGIVILQKRHPIYIVLIAIIGSFNRETSIMIPGLYFLNQVDFKNLSIHNILGMKKPITYTAVSYLLFFAIFIGIRMHFGYVPQEQWRVPAGLPMLKLNMLSLVSVKSYFEMYGTVLFLPFLIFFGLKKYSHYLIIGFFYLVPVWFAIHLVMVVAYQSRLFLVPTLLILIPMLLQLVSTESKRLYKLN
ncbi:hypothetical protein BFP72_04025 [Reichenbachiella sp. 5M10]|uniref:hypothetical protein n=1 Tax=Reichenbachiella sp. 5M10 TaxID=1889772 RepID=UPI000C14D96D|nr:hypothetical protein [Reichenbachiella sp. 5M10]PIB34635.1 hypothetical protein BFP72_04025 [Reichenbachiella sp. 5M10]